MSAKKVSAGPAPKKKSAVAVDQLTFAQAKAELVRLGLHVIDASAQGWGIINHDLFLSNAKVRHVIRRAIDGRPIDRA